MAKEDGYSNLIPLNQRAKDAQREIQSKGGYAKAKKMRKKKAVREVMEMLANQPLTNDKLKKSIKGITAGVEDDDIDLLTAATMGIFQSAIRGNEKAYRLIAEHLAEAQELEEMPEDELSKSLREIADSM